MKLLVVCLLLASCSAHDGVDGKNGNTGWGLPGAPGQQGAQGEPGVNGADGAMGPSCHVAMGPHQVVITCPDGSTAHIPIKHDDEGGSDE